MENAKWYVIHTYSGYENKVKGNIERIVENRNMHDKIVEIRMPEEEVVEVKDGAEKVSRRKLFPGYLFVKMVMDNDSWYVIRNTRGVTSFVGPESKPVPLSEEEILSLNLEERKMEIDFGVGDSVHITEGPLADFIGEVTSVDAENFKFTVVVSMFGRETPVELEYGQAELLD
ncbi:MAG: transcription termination/antitermination factor NusG [Clostridia bacterium]|nr:transcription termination/antitermination factor NusG [Clostridia bacterium]